MTGPSRKRSTSAVPAANRRLLDSGLNHLREGFVALSEAKVPFRRLHCHDDIEISVNEYHPVSAIFGGGRIVLPPDYLVVFWAARPHGPIETIPGGWAHSIHVPLPWVIQWRLPAVVMQPLMAGEVLLDPPGKRPAEDLQLLKNWGRLMQQNREESRRIVLLEAEARLRRLAIDLRARESLEPRADDSRPYSRGALGRFERMASIIAKHFQEPLTIEDIAEAAHMQPASAMRVFRRFSGITIHDCLLRHRVSHAQRLLTTTDITIDSVGAQSGFGSTARFYASFRKLTGESPAEYRRTLWVQGTNEATVRPKASAAPSPRRRRRKTVT